MSKEDIQKVVDTWLKSEFPTTDEFNNVHQNCISKINQYASDDIIALCKEKLALVGTIETQFQLLLNSLSESSPEAAFKLIEKALMNNEIEDKTTLLRLLLRYPKERIIPLFVKAIPYIPPYDEYSGDAMVLALEKLIYWEVKLPTNIIKHALQDPAFRVQRIVIPYVIDRNMIAFKTDLNNLLAQEEIYDSELEQEIEVILEKWKSENEL